MNDLVDAEGDVWTWEPHRCFPGFCDLDCTVLGGYWSDDAAVYDLKDRDEIELVCGPVIEVTP